MSINHLRLASAILAAACGLPVVAQNTQPTAIQVPTEEQLAQYPRMTGFNLSPDGKHLLAIESQGDTRTILVWETDKLSAKPQVIGSSTMRILSASFLKNDMLSVTLWQPYDARIEGTFTKTFINKLLITDLAGKEWKEPLESAEIARTDLAKRLNALSVPSIKSRMASDPDHVIVESDGNGKDRDLFRYNVRTGAAKRVLRVGEKDFDVFFDASGAPQAKSRADSDAKGFYVATEIRNAATGVWEEHFRSYVKDRDVVEIVRMGPGPHTAVLRSSVGRDMAALFEYDIEKRKVIGTLFEHKYFDARGVKVNGDADPTDAGAFDGFTYDGLHGNEVHWVNPKFEAVIKGIGKSLGIREIAQPLFDIATGKRMEVPSLDGVSVTVAGFHDGDPPTYVVRVSGLAYPTEHYLLRGQKLTLLAKERPQLDRRALGSSRFTYYPARDGLNVPAFLTLPNPELCGPGPYKAVIHPHGGPWARDHMDFDTSGWVPMLVSRCHVVLQPQYRGSADWGRTLWMAGDAEWGQKMQDDKDDGAKWLVSEKLADPKRVAMFGFSYGGYAAFAAAVRPNGLYKCAISGAGVSDIEKIWAPFYTNPFYRDRQESTVKGLSPVKQADKIKIPIMVYHGERDQIVPLIQSEMFVEQARKSGQPVDYNVLQDYDHGRAWTRETMTKQLRLISEYLAKGCGGTGL
ncbi:MAG: S9 family peptidase [Burkholderiales bacterium]|nr:S9 family peptidase [Burkholderiales bacterium]